MKFISIIGMFFLLCILSAESIAPQAKFVTGPATVAKWIWYPVKFNRGKTHVFSRTTFELNSKVEKAVLRDILDDRGEIYINGHAVSREKYGNVTKYLKSGKNLIAYSVVNNGSGFGMIFRLDIRFTNGKTCFIVSNKNTKVAQKVPNGWNKLDFNDTNWLSAMEKGDGSAPPWSVNGNMVNLIGSPQEIAAFNKAWNNAHKMDASVLKKLEDEKFYPATLVWKNKNPFIQINGKLYPPVVRLGLHPRLEQCWDFVYKMRRSTLNFYQAAISVDEPGVWKKSGNYDFTLLDQRVNRLLNMNPEARLEIGISFPKMAKWSAENPDELIGYATGSLQDDRECKGDETRGRRKRPSPASKKFQKEAQLFVKACCQYIQSRPWGKRVYAVRPTYGVTAEAMYYGSAYDMPDTGKAMTRRFREFLRERYKNDAALHKAWHSSKENIATAVPPTVEERQLKNGFFRNPASIDKKVLDFYECMHIEMADFLINLARVVKENLPGRLAGFYDAYDVGKFYPPEGEHTLADRLLSSPYVDFLSAPYNYNNEARGAGSYGLKVHLPSTFNRYKKLSLLEADIRTHVAHLHEEGIVHKRELESLSIIRRDMVNNIFDHDGIQFHQFGGAYGPDWFNTPSIRQEIDKNIRIADFVGKNVKTQSVSTVAVIYNPKEFAQHGPSVRTFPFLVELKFLSIISLTASGHVFDLMSLEDFKHCKKSYKTVVFLNTFTLTAAEKSLLKKKLRRPGVTTIWTYAPGLVTPEGFSDKAMEDLTGIRLKSVWKALPLRAKVLSGGFVTINSRIKGIPAHLQNPRIYSADKNAEVIAKYADDNTPAYVRKKLQDGSIAVFLGFPTTWTGLWRKLLTQAGNHAFVKQNIIVRVNSHLIMVHRKTTAPCRINFPGRINTVVDIYNRKIVAKNINSFVVDDKKNTTSLFYYGDDAEDLLKKLKKAVK